MIFIYITCQNEKEAEKIGFCLVKKRLAACVNIFPKILSIFSWSSFAKATADKTGKIEKKNESVLIVKTVKNNFLKVEKEVKKLSGFTTPCILEIPISKGSQNYLNWIEKETK